MRKLNKSKNKAKAFGLVEVLVSLIIYGVAIIGVTSLTVSSYRIVKDNEIGDLGNSIMVRGVEYFKSANAIIQGGNNILPPNAGDTYVYTVDSAGANAIGNPGATFSAVKCDTCTTALITSCSASSVYSLNFASNLNQLGMCNQILVTKTASKDYIIHSVMVVNLSSRVDQNELIGLRPRLEQ